MSSRTAWFGVGIVVGVIAGVAGLSLAQGLLKMIDKTQSPLMVSTAPGSGRSHVSRPQIAGRAPRTPAEMVFAADLGMIRSQMELYRVQHLDRYPGTNVAGKFDGELFVRQLTFATNSQGQVGSQKPNQHYTLGPYMRSMPANPFVKAPQAYRVISGPGPVPGDASSGWYFQTTAGQLWANDPGHKEW